MPLLPKQYYTTKALVEIGDWVVVEDPQGDDHDYGQVVAIRPGEVDVQWFGVAVGDCTPTGIKQCWPAENQDSAASVWAGLVG